MIFKKLKNSRWLTQVAAFGSLAGLLVYGAMARAAKDPVPIQAKTINQWLHKGDIKARANLSQHKVVQGDDGLLYLKVDLEAPEIEKALLKERKPTDFVIVLDRSGSMSGEKKMDYAIRAVEALVRQMSARDRFSLVTFDSTIETPIPLLAVNAANRSQILNQLKTIGPRGSTDLGGGLQEGMKILRHASDRSKRAQRLILVSDGQANQGITDPNQLNKIAHRAVAGEFVISTIGVGLDFNETLMASLADFGTGHYHFLEQLAKLDDVLAKEFKGASQIYAKQLELKLNFGPGIEVVEASGYPLQKKGSYVLVQPGHLYAGQHKTLFVTLKVPTNKTYTRSLGTVDLDYRTAGAKKSLRLLNEGVRVACLPPEQRKEAHASINKSVFKDAWVKNNYGGFLKESAQAVRKGDKGGALRTLRRYKAKLGAAYSMAPTPELKQQLEEVDKLEGEVNDAFTGDDQDAKKKRFSKQKQATGIAAQRK